MSKRLEQYSMSAALDRSMEWSRWSQEIPYIVFPKGWRVKIVPPFGAAVVRFVVCVGGKSVSVYLDCYENLGLFGEPYWEVYPVQGDTFRCKMADTDALVSAIGRGLNDQKLPLLKRLIAFFTKKPTPK